MKTYYNTRKWICLLALPIFLLASCAKMDEYKKFVESGEISYTGRIDSVIVYSGDGRVIIEGLFKSDPKVKSCRIYWNNKRDSVDVPVIKTGGIDTLRTVITLPENLYNFQIHTFDAEGNKSVPVYAVGQSYGDLYKESISNRLILSAIGDDQNTVQIIWRNIDKTLGAIGTKIEYTDINNKKQKLYTSIDVSSSTLPNYKAGTKFSFQTLYIPDTLSVDTFQTAFKEQGYSFRIDRSNWVATADTYEPTGQMPHGGSPHFVLDGDPNTYWHTIHSSTTTPYPHWLAFDMKRSVKVDMVELTSRHDYLGSDFKDFLIEGRNSESEEWKTYGSFTLPDIKGPQQFLISSSPTLRYLRINMISGQSPPHAHLSEFSVYGDYMD